MNGMDPKSGATNATNATLMEGEEGSTDNRLVWSPGEFPETQDWEDGQTYTVTLTIKQTSPGAAEVLSMETEGAGEEGPVASEDAGMTEPTDSTDYPENPAVGRLMRSRKA